MLRIGITAGIFHPDPNRAVFKGKTLVFLDQSLASYVQAGGALAFLVPLLSGSGEGDLRAEARRVVQCFDGMIFQGGVDVAPQSYGETPLMPEWAGDPLRDANELALFAACLELGKPVLGICRGHQLINVALGGTLFQDIQTQIPASRCHRDWEVYDKLHHGVAFEPRLAKLFGRPGGLINSVHHQALKDVAPDLCVEAYAEDDGVVEAVRFAAGGANAPYVAGVQWHPEFQTPQDRHLIDPWPVLRDFLAACEERVG